MRIPLTFAVLAAIVLAAGCSSPTTSPTMTMAPGQTMPSQSMAPTTHPATSAPAATGSFTGSTGPYTLPSGSVSLSGSGATFPKPLIEAWAIQFTNLHPSVSVSYGGGGSGKGIADIKGNLVAFAGSDAPLQPADYPAAADILQFPEAIGPVAIVYNVGDLATGFHLTCDVLGKIYTGAITTWADPAITALNNGHALPDAPIATVHRSDSSGTTFVFSDYMSHCSDDWKNTIGSSPSKTPAWTQSNAAQLAGSGNDGVATTVANNPGSIGYVDLAYAIQLHLATAALQNKHGDWVMPSAEAAGKAAAAAASTLPAPTGDWSKVSIVDSSAEGAYPISSFTYMLVYHHASSYGAKMSGDQLAALKAWLYWDIHEGQQMSGGLYYAPLPAPVVAIGENAIASLGS